jgi:hypothetical protein
MAAVQFTHDLDLPFNCLETVAGDCVMGYEQRFVQPAGPERRELGAWNGGSDAPLKSLDEIQQLTVLLDLQKPR